MQILRRSIATSSYVTTATRHHDLRRWAPHATKSTIALTRGSRSAQSLRAATTAADATPGRRTEQANVDYLGFKRDASGDLRPEASSISEAATLSAHQRASRTGKSLGRDPRYLKSDSSTVLAYTPSEREGIRASGASLNDLRSTRHVKASKEFEIVRERKRVDKMRAQIYSTGRKLGLVPTMGALHEGHLSLIRHAADENDEVWVSIFVNPTQFGPTEDLATYPKTFDEDLRKIRDLNTILEREGKRGKVTGIFAPTVRTMYPGVDFEAGAPTGLSYVSVDDSLTTILEGAARPTFFRGVTTVVMKLFNIVQPDRAYFGQKDVQQLVVINRMKRDFMLDIDIRAVPIERADDGIALSSRNAYLGVRRRTVAAVLNRALKAGEKALLEGKTSRQDVLDAALKVASQELEKQRDLPPHMRARFEVDYISLSGFHNLKEIDDAKDVRQAVLSGTILMLPLEEPQADEVLGQGGDKNTVRLLDNIIWKNPTWRQGHNHGEDGGYTGEDEAEAVGGVQASKAETATIVE